MVKPGSPITGDNYVEIIARLTHEEKQTFGMVKHDNIIKFLKEWFEG